MSTLRDGNDTRIEEEFEEKITALEERIAEIEALIRDIATEAIDVLDRIDAETEGPAMTRLRRLSKKALAARPK